MQQSDNFLTQAKVLKFNYAKLDRGNKKMSLPLFLLIARGQSK